MAKRRRSERPDQCAAVFQRLEGATIQRIGIYSTHCCSRKARVTMRHVDGSVHSFCSQHARMAAQGFVDSDACVMDPCSRADYQRAGSRCGQPFDHGRWTRAEHDPERGWSVVDPVKRIRWWPDEGASEEIGASGDAAPTLLQLHAKAPERGVEESLPDFP